jgi:quercetin 2,3-dioxygenase
MRGTRPCNGRTSAAGVAREPAIVHLHSRIAIDDPRPAMIVRRPGEERGRTRISWLDSRHSFSFGEYYDPRHMGFGPLRVINEDWVAPGAGFPTHGHRDMEIVTYVIEGALEHKDSLGTGSIIRPGEVQRMSAGTGILHSEFNPSRTDPVHLLQIWILPSEQGVEPSYEQKPIPAEGRTGRFATIAAPDGEGGVRIRQDARILAAEIPAGVAVAHDLGVEVLGRQTAEILLFDLP